MKNMINSWGLCTLSFLAIFGMTGVSCNKSHDPSVPEISLSPANCHIVSTPGAYSFQTVKGNSVESVGAVASAEVLWESFGTAETPSKGSVIAEVVYNSADGHIHFKTPTTLKNGNALIAVKDASGNILWSWHIWVCDGWDPVKTAHTYYHNAGVIMDRNLGALSATPGEATALGLLYQWGRKDPFIGSSSISDDVEAASTLIWPSPVLSTQQTGTIAYATANPTTFIASTENNYDWFYTGEFSTDNTRWQEKKTVYDPCPAGWKLPNGSSPYKEDFWITAIDNKRFLIYPMDHTFFGLNLNNGFGDADPIWYPLAGYRVDYSGLLWGVGRYSGNWTSTPDLDESDPAAKVMALGLEFDLTERDDVMVFPSYDYCRAFAASVRCVVDESAF